MSDYIDNIVSQTGEYSATYLPVPVANQSLQEGGCVLPDATGGVLSLPTLTPPDSTKFCSPLFIEFPIVPVPFSVPENCPSGITFNTKNVSIFSSPTATSPSGALSIGASRSSSDFCTFNFNMPDIVIPCYPNGPVVTGEASIQVVNPNTGVTSTSSFSIQQDSPCNWSLQGGAVIQLPTVACPNGPAFIANTLKITSTCPSLSTFVDYLPVAISKQPDSACSYVLDLPTIQIPCYPDGPSFSGGFAVNVTDSGLPISTGTQIATVGTAGCCNYIVDGIIDIDIPCGTSGNTVTFSDWVVNDPTKALTDSNHTVTIANPTIVTNPTFCENNVQLPVINIPCLNDGFTMAPIGLSGLNFLNNTVTALTPISLSPTNTICNIGGTVNLPMPICSGGMTVYNTSSIRVSASRTLTNSLQLSKTGGSGGNECGFELGGVLDLGLGDVSLCSALNVTGNVQFKLSGVTPPNTKTISIKQSSSACNLAFTDTVIDLPTLNCPSGFQTSTLFKIKDTNGNTIYDATSSTNTNGTSLALSSNSCGVTLAGNLVIPVTGGSGVGIANWNMGDYYPSGGAVYYIPPEGALASYYNSCPTTIDPGNVPGADSECWWQQYQSTPGPVFPGFTIIRCEEPAVTNLSNPVVAMQSDQTYKVVPRSYLYQSTETSDRYYIFGLDTPFKIAPGQEVFLEVVFNQGTTQDSLSVAYAAICVGTRDFAVTTGTPPTTIPAMTTKSVAKFITPTQASLILTDAVALAAYLKSCVGQIVGITDATAADLTKTLSNAFTTIQTRGTTTASKSQNFQLKAYLPIGKATAISTDSSTVVVGSSMDLACSYTVTTPASPGTPATTTISKFGIKQLHTGHLGLKAANDQTKVYNLLVPYSGDPPAALAASPDDANPASNLVLATTQEFVPSYNGPAVVAPTLLAQVSNLYKPVTIIASYANNMGLHLGVDSESLHVYYTTDGTVPSINTYTHKTTKLYDPSKIGDSNRLLDASQGPVIVNWFMVYQDFTLAGVSTHTIPRN